MAHLRSWLLVSAPARNMADFPLGLAYISAVLKRAGYTVHCLDLALAAEGDYRTLISQAIRDHDIGVVGVGGMSKDFCEMRLVFAAAAEERPGIVTVAGGGALSSDPELTLEALDIRYGVIGEGEETVVELARLIADGGDPAEILGLIYRDDGGAIRRNKDRPGVRDLDTLPMPDYEGFDPIGFIERQRSNSSGVHDTILDTPRFFPVMFSRSCPFKCTFCYHPIVKYRTHSLDRVFDEIALLVRRYNINALNISDDLFAVKRDRIEEFCRRVKSTGLIWTCQLRVNVVTDELLDMMREAGCYQISFGFESMSDDVLTSMKKKITAHDIELAAAATYRAKIDIQANFIFGDPAETYDSINQTLTWWARNLRYHINLGTLQCYPGAQIYHRAIAEGIIADPLEFLRNACPMVNLTTLSASEFGDFLMCLGAAYPAGRIPAPLVACNPTRTQEAGRHAVTLICPHCRDSVHYSDLPVGNVRVICKSCRGRVDIPHSLLLGRSASPELHTKALSVAAGLLSAGLAREDQQTLDRATGLIQSVLAEQVYDADALHMLGVAHLIGGGDGAQALRLLQFAATYAPDSARVHTNLAAAYLMQGRLGWGLLHARHALTLDPDLPEVVHNARIAEEVAGGDVWQFLPVGQPVPRERLQGAFPVLSTPRTIPLRPPLRAAAVSHHPIPA